MFHQSFSSSSLSSTSVFTLRPLVPPFLPPFMHMYNGRPNGLSPDGERGEGKGGEGGRRQLDPFVEYVSLTPNCSALSFYSTWYKVENLQAVLSSSLLLSLPSGLSLSVRFGIPCSPRRPAQRALHGRSAHPLALHEFCKPDRNYYSSVARLINMPLH